jgi:flavin-dependent dehydrogenase
VLEDLGIDLDQYPALRSLTYRLPGRGSVKALLPGPSIARGARRLVFDQRLAEAAANTPNVELIRACRAYGIRVDGAVVTLSTSSGEVKAPFVVGADGQRSCIAEQMGWSRPAASRRYAFVAHVEAPCHRMDGITVSLLPGYEAYLTPTTEDEVLVALLGDKRGLRREGETVRTAYARRLAEAHPELAGCRHSAIRGAGPFWSRPARIADGRVFLVGDAAGFLDPLTGDGISAGLVAAGRLASILGSGAPDPAGRYRKWERADWRRRVFVARLALMITRSALLSRRAMRGLSRRPATFERLLLLNDGRNPRLRLSARDWTALVGI